MNYLNWVYVLIALGVYLVCMLLIFFFQRGAGADQVNSFDPDSSEE